MFMKKIMTSPLSSKTNYWGVRTVINPTVTHFIAALNCLLIIALVPIMPCHGSRQCIESMGLPYNYPELIMFVLCFVPAFSCVLFIGHLGMNQSELFKRELKKNYFIIFLACILLLIILFYVIILFL